MVGPTTSEERRVGRRQVAAAFVVLVAASAGLIALRAGSSPAELAAAVAVGALVGGALVWYVIRLLREAGRERHSRR